MHALGVLKPDAVFRCGPGARILKNLIDSGLGKFLCFEQVDLPTSLLETHYHHVQGRDFYPWMIDLLANYPAYVLLVETNDDELDKLRGLLGYTRSHQAHPKSLRYQFCPYGGMNGFHLSEDREAAQTETTLWKNALGVRPGCFSISIESYIAQYLDQPNYTTRLRQVCFEIRAKGYPPQRTEIDQLAQIFTQECVGADQSQIEWLAQKLARGTFLGEVKNPPIYTGDEPLY